MRKLTPTEKLILERLIYPETFEVIQDETKLEYGEIRDDLINLVSYRLVEVVDREYPEADGTFFYDADNLNESKFRITKSGIKQLKRRS